MNSKELAQQKMMVKVFEELKMEVKSLESKVNTLGWKQRNALISHVCSNYSEHEKLNEAKTKWENMHVTLNVHKWLYDLMVKHRDLFGYFEDHEEMLAEIDSIILAGTKTERYEIVGILTKWRKELPNPIEIITQ